MANEKKSAGFVYSNTGTIADCYSAVKPAFSQKEDAGFVYTNAGHISRSFARIGGKKNGFAAVSRGTLEDVFFLCKNDDDRKSRRDADRGLPVDDAGSEKLREDYHWDFGVFEEKNAGEMDFSEEGRTQSLQGTNEAAVAEIGSVSELQDMIRDVNSGAAEPGTHYLLTKDLDLRGKKLTPIGVDREFPFDGCFDGGGHRIKGFVLDGKGLSTVGFFGHIAPDGWVGNLRVDCIVTGKSCPTVAAFCGENKGTISCCEAVCSVSASRNMGAFAGTNAGEIIRCCVSGKSTMPLLPLLLSFLPLFPMLVLGGTMVANPIVPAPDFVPIVADETIVKNTSDEPKNSSGAANQVTIRTPAEVRLDAATLSAHQEPYVIQNPDDGGNYDMVAAIAMKNGAGEDVEVFRSGLIPIGYHITDVTLTPPEGMTLTPGRYEATVYFTFYNHETGEKGFVDSNLPITLIIE